VTVSFFFPKYLPWPAMHFLQRCRLLITSKFLVSELPFHCWKSPEITWGKIWTVWRMFKRGSTDPLFPSRTQIHISPHNVKRVLARRQTLQIQKEKLARVATVLFQQVALYKIKRHLTKYNIEIIHVPVKKTFHIPRTLKYKMGLKVAGIYECVSKSFRTESITKYTLTTINTLSEATQRVMEAKLARLTYKIAIQLHLMAESCTICSSRSGRPVWKLLDTHSYVVTCECSDVLYWTDWQIHGNT
jgi:hypothetical protein